MSSPHFTSSFADSPSPFRDRVLILSRGNNVVRTIEGVHLGSFHLVRSPPLSLTFFSGSVTPFWRGEVPDPEAEYERGSSPASTKPSSSSLIPKKAFFITSKKGQKGEVKERSGARKRLWGSQEEEGQPSFPFGALTPHGKVAGVTEELGSDDPWSPVHQSVSSPIDSMDLERQSDSEPTSPRPHGDSGSGPMGPRSLTLNLIKQPLLFDGSPHPLFAGQQASDRLTKNELFAAQYIEHINRLKQQSSGSFVDLHKTIQIDSTHDKTSLLSSFTFSLIQSHVLFLHMYPSGMMMLT